MLKQITARFRYGAPLRAKYYSEIGTKVATFNNAKKLVQLIVSIELKQVQNFCIQKRIH